MKICIVSDSHDRADPLLRAVRAAREAGAEVVVHCGDVIGAHTLRPLLAVGLPVHVVHGNNLGDTLALVRLATSDPAAASTSPTTRTRPAAWPAPGTTIWCAAATRTRPA